MIKLILPFLFYSVLFFNVLVNAKDITSLLQRNKEMVMKCAKEIPVPPEDVEKFIKLQMPEKETSKCLLACIFKSLGMIDNQGMLSVEGVNKLASRLETSGDHKLQISKQAKQFTDTCRSVNDIEVLDGDKGCERAALMLVCGAEKAPEFIFFEEITLHIVYYTVHNTNKN